MSRMLIMDDYREGSDVIITATFTDAEGATANPSSVDYIVFRDEEATEVQASASASTTGNVASIIVGADNVRVGAGKSVSTYAVEIEATMSGGIKLTAVHKFRVHDQRSIS